MKKAPNIWDIRDLVKAGRPQTCINDRWVPARPIGFDTVRHRLRCAWLAFTGKADVVIWEGGQ